MSFVHRVNRDIQLYFQNLFSSKITNQLSAVFYCENALQDMNKIIRKGNFYALDKFNLIIRKNDKDKIKSPFGWVFSEENEPINIHINSILLRLNKKNIDDVCKQTLVDIKNKFPEIFARQKIWKKVYSDKFPEIIFNDDIVSIAPTPSIISLNEYD
jgi:hypothetical protein